MITFSKALPLFTVTLTVAFTFLLLKSKEKKQVNHGKFHLILIITSLLASLGATLTLLLNFRESLLYYAILIATTLGIVVFSLQSSSRKGNYLTLLYPIFMWQVMVLFDQIPEIGIHIGEGTHMTRFMVNSGAWDFRAAHNPSYNPIPTVALTITALALVTSIAWYNWFLTFFIFYFPLIIAYNITLLLLSEEITRSRVAGVLAILLLTLTPQTNLLMHPYQWSGSLLVLISSLMFIRLVRKRMMGTQPEVVCMILSFASAVLAHPTAGIEVFLPYMGVAVGFLMLHILKLKDFTSSIVLKLKKPILLTGTLLLTILLARAIHTAGFSEYVLPILMSFFSQMFISEAEKGLWSPLYDRAGINFIQAYAWAFAPSLATAFILMKLLKRKIKFWHLTLFVMTAVFISLGYLAATLTVPASGAIYRGTYVAIPFIMPMAALALSRTLRASRRSIAVFSLISILMATVIAVSDPNISPREYARIRGGYVFLSNDDLSEAADILQNLGMHKELYVKSASLSGYVYPYSGGKVKLSRDRLRVALDTIAFIQNIELPHGTVKEMDIHTMSEESFNKIYNSGRSLVFVPE